MFIFQCFLFYFLEILRFAWYIVSLLFCHSSIYISIHLIFAFFLCTFFFIEELFFSFSNNFSNIFLFFPTHSLLTAFCLFTDSCCCSWFCYWKVDKTLQMEENLGESVLKYLYHSGMLGMWEFSSSLSPPYISTWAKLSGYSIKHIYTHAHKEKEHEYIRSKTDN